MSTELPVSTPTKTNYFLRVLKTESFIEKAFLLILTGILSGVIVPLVFKSIDSARERRDAIARAQAKLFDDVSETILTSETLILDVSWYGTKRVKNVESQKKAFERYTERVVELVVSWRVQTSRAQALASPQVAQKLSEFQNLFFGEQDTPTNELWFNCGPNCDWDLQHKKNNEMLGKANTLILELATDLGLSKN